eukprot:CAMPEP_0202445556 /NCGR_PEP_ID=MMETSP1360-20130828/4344_1 /ASSEMBLY_ACC=CAM_ASM_000848 /TAXON_ID=515479 /ORGANISM="Licmophora paradoxa, Strain CCMP2313" /LENGTH=555 /DNA_ID=CAMNT_0049061857 /DNA_START=59 /DNA_END=1726 /DNA_ORIENTATION=-
MMDYAIDYGHPVEDEYEMPLVRRTTFRNEVDNTMIEVADLSRTKRACLRQEALKKYYKGKTLLVAMASGNCEAMDAMMDRIDYLQFKWIEYRISNEDEPITEDQRRVETLDIVEALDEMKLLITQFAERAGLSLTGKKTSNAERVDIRSPIEMGLCEEVWEHVNEFFSGIEQRVKTIEIKDSMIKTTISQLRDLLEELHDRNMKSLNNLGVRYPEPSRQRKSRRDLTTEIRSRLQAHNKQDDEKAGTNDGNNNSNSNSFRREALSESPKHSVEKSTSREVSLGTERSAPKERNFTEDLVARGVRATRSFRGITETEENMELTSEPLSSSNGMTKDAPVDSVSSTNENSNNAKGDTKSIKSKEITVSPEPETSVGRADPSNERPGARSRSPPVSKYLLSKKSLEKQASTEGRVEQSKEDIVNTKRPVSKYLARKAAAMEKESSGEGTTITASGSGSGSRGAGTGATASGGGTGEGNQQTSTAYTTSSSRPRSPAGVRRSPHVRTHQRGRDDRPRRASTTIAAASTEDRLAAIAARRQNIRESIAARKKAKEDTTST